MKLNRRNFTKLIIASALIPSTAEAAPHERYLRPPGALPEDEFIARCNRCQRCVQVCETRVVLPASFTYGVLVANTPIVTFKRNYCNSCLKCSLVCPTKALLPVTKESLDIGIAEIVKENCVAWDWMGCTVCIDKCPLKALTLDEYKRPVLDYEKCNGCGICELECPSTSLRASIKGKGIIVVPRTPDIPPRKILPPEALP